MTFFFFFFGLFVFIVGYHAKACPYFFGTSNRAMEEEVSKKVDEYINKLLESAEICEDEGVIYTLSYATIRLFIKQKNHPFFHYCCYFVHRTNLHVISGQH